MIPLNILTFLMQLHRKKQSALIIYVKLSSISATYIYIYYFQDSNKKNEKSDIVSTLL